MLEKIIDILTLLISLMLIIIFLPFLFIASIHENNAPADSYKRFW